MPLETPEKPVEEQPPPKPRNNKPRSPLLVLAGLIVLVGLLGALAWDVTQNKKVLGEKVPGTEQKVEGTQQKVEGTQQKVEGTEQKVEGTQKQKVEGTQHNAVLGITIFIQAMIAFFGVLNLEEPHVSRVSPLTKGGMRSAITAAFVVTYIFLVIFHTMVDFGTRVSPIKDAFVNSFTTWLASQLAFSCFRGRHILD